MLLRATLCCLVWTTLAASASWLRAADAPGYEKEIAPLLKQHCVKCHGPAKQEGKLDLSVPGALVRGGKNGAALVPHDVDGSLIWQRVEADEMPPEMPLNASEKRLLKEWIIAGAPGLPAQAGPESAAAHWSFQPLQGVQRPVPKSPMLSRNGIDDFIQSRLDTAGLTLSAPADRYTLIRRVSLDVTGLPPTPEDIQRFVDDPADDAVAQMIERYLASPHAGERIGKVWLDAAGYCDSNGYFNADSDRPLAYRYRDWVVRAFNRDMPYDQFVRTQIAGDELAQFDFQQHEAAPEVIELLEATHYIRNGQDGTGESDGNNDEVRIDRYTSLESNMQNMATSLLGLTVQCAKCHDHKFEPITQQDYYSFQAVLAGVFAPDQWLKPNERVAHVALPGEHSKWQTRLTELRNVIDEKRNAVTAWVAAHRPQGEVLFADDFQGDAASLSARWTNTVPGDSAPAGKVAVQLNRDSAPAARIVEGQLQVLAGGLEGTSGLATQQTFDWTPNAVGESIQVTFDLVASRLTENGTPAERLAYFIALRDFNDKTDQPGGCILIDGNPGGSTSVYTDYPGDDNQNIGPIGKTGYQPGHNYGVRITNQGDDKYLLEHLADWQAEEKTLTFKAADLPDGAFGLEYFAERSWILDNVRIERFTKSEPDVLQQFTDNLAAQRKDLDAAQAELDQLSGNQPGRLAMATDVSATPPAIHLLLRGNHATPGPVAEPAPFTILRANPQDFTIVPPGEKPHTTGRRLAWANWVTHPGSRPAALLARVHVNRLWQLYFGTGLVATPENLGLSGAPPSHPELLEWLAGELVRSNWSTRHIQRLILNSATYGQVSAEEEQRRQLDPDCRLLSRFPIRRLDAESIRDSMLLVSGDLDKTQGGPYIPTTREGNGEVVVPDSQPGALRRSLYLQQRRTQVLSLLQVFDAPSIVFNSSRRPRSTIPLQSLSLMNSGFVRDRAQHLADRLKSEYPSEPERMAAAILLTASRPASEAERAAITEFLDSQVQEYQGDATARDRAWVDLAQMLLASNAFLYVE